ncbi:MAG: tetratricopeptide repeat protein [Acidobacteria bacterium]|nr:tetratricopeptide repeat protein [Acidobacteriota bacterium]MCA1648844.1 tetratricopeptide repeat protein [Acidobacteriota bacterium]
MEAWENARDEFLKAIRIVKVFPNAYYGLGKAHMGLRAYEKAAEAFSMCRDQYTMLVGSEFTRQLASRQHRQDQIQELRDIIRELQNSRANQNRAAQGMPQSRQVRDLQGYLRQIDDFERSGRSLTPEMSVPAEVYLSLGSALFRSSKLKEAEAEYRNAVKAKPDFGEAYNNLAVVCLLMGRAREADDFVKKAEKSGFRVNPQLKDQIRAKS